MSIDKQHVAPLPPASKSEVIPTTAASETSPAARFAGGSATTAQVKRKRWYTSLPSLLWLCLLMAVIIRVWLTVRTHGTLDSDEALLGIQAQHILQGEHPIYFYGIPYFGSLEAYVAALIFAIFGPSVAALRAETTVYSLASGRATWWLAPPPGESRTVSPSTPGDGLPLWPHWRPHFHPFMTAL